MKNGIFPLVSIVALLWACDETAAEVRRFRLGGNGGEGWQTWTGLQAMMDDAIVHGALQPLELRPDENVVPRLGAWMLYKQPLDFHYRDGIPRIWRAEGIARPGENNPLDFVDGDPETFYTDTDFNKMRTEFYTLDLGGQVPAERFVFYPPEGQDPFIGEPYHPNYALKKFELTGSNDVEGVQQEEGSSYRPLDIPLAHVEQNFNPIVEIRFQPRHLRFFRLRSFPDGVNFHGRAIIKRYAVAEMEIYGRGFVPLATWESRVIDLGEEVNLGRVLFGSSIWRREGEELVEAPQAPVEVRVEVKTGLDDSPLAYHGYNDLSERVEVTEAEYERLKPRVFPWDPEVVGWRGPIAEDRRQWSFWSAPVRESGARPRVPRGRHVQVRVELATASLWEFARMDSLALELSPLLAARVVAEVAVADDLHPQGGLARVRAGESTQLIHELKGEFSELKGEFSGVGQSGFDAVRILTPWKSTLRGLEMGAPPTPAQPDSVVAEPEGLVVYLPRRISRNEQRVRLRLETAVYSAAWELETEVFERAGANFPQRVEGGDASAEIGTNQLRVVALASSLHEVLGNLAVNPPVFTPQGDGVNDRVKLEYTLFRVAEGRAEVVVYSLAGERLWRSQAGPARAGLHTLEWDGRNTGGHLVSPGLYLVRVEVETDRGRFARWRPVAVAY